MFYGVRRHTTALHLRHVQCIAQRKSSSREPEDCHCRACHAETRSGPGWTTDRSPTWRLCRRLSSESWLNRCGLTSLSVTLCHLFSQPTPISRNRNGESHRWHHRRCWQPAGDVAGSTEYECCIRHCWPPDSTSPSSGIIRHRWSSTAVASFLTDRTQLIAFSGARSTLQSLLCGLPQRSVLGLLLFVLYSTDIIKIAANHGVCIHAYADDIQTYAGCSAPDQQIVTSRLLACVGDIEAWMKSNRLKLYADKTEFIWLGTRQQLAKDSQSPLLMKGQFSTPLNKVRRHHRQRTEYGRPNPERRP